MKTLAEAITYDRSQIGLSQADLASKLGVSQQSVSKWESLNENEVVLPRLRVRIQLVELFGKDSETSKWLDSLYPPTLHNPKHLNLSTGQKDTLRYVVRDSGDEGAIKRYNEDPDEFEIRHHELATTLHNSHDGIQSTLQRHLPAELHQYCDKRIGAGNISTMLDYLSPRTAAELRIFTVSSQYQRFVHKAIFNLLIAERLLTLGGQKPKMVVFVIGLDTYRLDLQKLQADASILGVSIISLHNIEHAAKLLALWEQDE